VWPAAPLPERDEDEQQSEDELQDVDPGRRLAVVVRVRRPRNRQDDRPDDREADEPPEHEGRPVGACPRRHEHEDHRDDRARG
jgi:hypothetical protein